jgi:WhiB family redox-sensing transcriptional regulator
MTNRGQTPNRHQAATRAKGVYDLYTRRGGDTHKRDWMKDAACRGADPEIFFPHRGTGRSADRYYRRAVLDIRLQFCNHCPVASQCLDYAVGQDIRFGIYGGRGEHERPHGGVA